MMATASDPRVRAAIAHWASRFIANGVDYNDFESTTARVERWERWSAEWSRTAARHEQLAREAEERESPISAAEAYVRAALCHHFGKFVFFDDVEQYRAAGAATVATYRKAAKWLDPPAERVAIPYAGTTLPGYLRKPSHHGAAGVPPAAGRASRPRSQAGDPPPVVLILSGLDSVKEEMHTLEPLFHRRGVATLAFDGPGQGESEGLPIEPAFERVVAAAVDWLAERADVDGSRVAAVGVSLGGYYAARAAAFEPRLVGAVSIGGPYDFGEIFDDLPSLTQQAIRVRSHVADLATARQRAAELTLRDVAGRIEMPILIVFGKQDRLIPYQQAERLFAEVPARDKRLEMYPDGNHVCNNIPFAYRPLVADWVAAVVGE